MDPLRLRLIYDGAGPIVWSRRADAFGLQDKDELLHLGTPGPDHVVVFDLSVGVKQGKTSAPVLTGPFAHGPASARFLYLAWRDARGAFAQRLKLPLGGISWDDIHRAAERRSPLVGTLVDHHPRITSTGANIGGTRPMSWV